MSTRRICYITIDVGSFQVVNTGDFAVRADNFRLKAGDSAGVVFRIRFVNQLPDGTVIPFVFADAAVPKLLAKVQGDYDGPALILSDSARWDDPDDWPDRDGADGEHSVRVVTNTTAALEHFTAADEPSVAIGFEIELNTPGEGISTIAEFDASLWNQYTRGDEGDPEEAVPAYAQEDWVLAAIDAALNARIEDGIVLTKESGTMKVTVDSAPRGNI